MRYGSVCSGIEAASVAWHPLGWTPAWFAEIEAFPSAVLAHRFPHVMNVGDMLNLPALIRARIIEAPDVIVGGTPCQAFSVAGNRESLNDDRGQLSLAFIDIINAIDEVRHAEGKQPVIVVWENVPGVLNTSDNAFGCFLGELSGSGEELQPTGKKWSNAGYIIGPRRQIAYRILDAQYFGVAQRRRRVFVVSSARTGFNPSEILFEFEGVRWDTPPSREKGQEVTRNAGNSTPGIRGHRLVAFGQYADDETASTVKRRDYKDATDLIVGTLDTQCGYEKAAFQSVVAGHIIAQKSRVRRLLTVECARLQGFPDDWTKVPYKNKSAEDCPDGPQYEAYGNSMAVPVMHWIGKRIDGHVIIE